MLPVMKKSILINNIGRLVTMEPGRDRDGPIGVIEDAAVLVKDGNISWFGSRHDWLKFRNNGKKSNTSLEEFDAKGGVATPGLIDCHTHLVHAGYRQNEFLLRSEGKTYLDIAKAGGGIMSSVQATRSVSFEDLYRLSNERADEAFGLGTLAMEVKTGYGLDLPTELKMLDVIRTLNDKHPIYFYATFLGAHVVPAEFKNHRDDYLRLIIDKMLPVVAQDRFCSSCDIFVEEGAFTPDEARAIAKAAQKHHMAIRLHADQFQDGGGGELAAELKALSADHLDYISDKGIRALKRAGVVAVVLPGATFFTGDKNHAPARKMIDKGVKVAIATDYNPGTNPCINLMLTATIAVTQLGLTLDEAWKGITIHPAAALGIENEAGSIAIGKRADLVLFDAHDEYYPLYRYGKNCIDALVINGAIHNFKK
jgi:imidazolonepropionase